MVHFIRLEFKVRIPTGVRVSTCALQRANRTRRQVRAAAASREDAMRTTVLLDKLRSPQSATRSEEQMPWM